MRAFFISATKQTAHTVVQEKIPLDGNRLSVVLFLFYSGANTECASRRRSNGST